MIAFHFAMQSIRGNKAKGKGPSFIAWHNVKVVVGRLDRRRQVEAGGGFAL
jgi:hypothetical protein